MALSLSFRLRELSGYKVGVILILDNVNLGLGFSMNLGLLLDLVYRLLVCHNGLGFNLMMD